MPYQLWVALPSLFVQQLGKNSPSRGVGAHRRGKLGQTRREIVPHPAGSQEAWWYVGRVDAYPPGAHWRISRGKSRVGPVLAAPSREVKRLGFLQAQRGLVISSAAESPSSFSAVLVGTSLR